MKKIMFNDRYGLTKAVLDVRKTQTRRIIKCPKKFKGNDVYGFYVCERVTDGVITDVLMYDEEKRCINEGQILPKYKVGEVVAVAQSYHTLGYAPNALDRSPKGWHNKMFVRAEACKHHVRITGVRVEQLQDISDGDCIKEGIIKKWHAPAGRNYYYVPGVAVKSAEDVHDTPREAFARLIDKVSGKGTWESNLYVWVYEFELLD